MSVGYRYNAFSRQSIDGRRGTADCHSTAMVRCYTIVIRYNAFLVMPTSSCQFSLHPFPQMGKAPSSSGSHQM